MIQTKVPFERQHHRKTLQKALKNAFQSTNSPFLYLTARGEEIVTTFIPESELFSIGFSKIITYNSPPEQEIDFIVLVTVIGDQAITQLERYWHLFKEITVINLNISGRETKELLRVSPLRKKLKGFIELSLNFVPFLDSVFCSHTSKNQQQVDRATSFEESLSSLLTSFPKFHEFQISLINKGSAQTVSEQIKINLLDKLSVLDSHKCPEYSSVASPRIKVLVLQRKIDQMSPLLYSYHYGAVTQEMKAFENIHKKFTTNSNIYKAFYHLQIGQALEKIELMAQQKAQNQKQKFQLHDFQKAKKVISNHFDESTSPQEIQIQINAIKSAKEFCQGRFYTTILQQTITNARSQTDFKMTPGKVVDYVVQWANIDQSKFQKFKPSKDDYHKIVILSYMLNSFWFWQRRILNAGLEKDAKDKIVAFCKKVEGKFKPLEEKPQSQDRRDLYRHDPIILKEINAWLNNDKSEKYLNTPINQTAMNKDSKRVIVIKGPLGYGELAMILRQLKSKEKTTNCTIFCESLVTTKEYLDIILRQK